VVIWLKTGPSYWFPSLTIAIELWYVAIVKTVTKSISLHEELADFANQEAEEGCYGNVSAYFAHLLRQRRQARIDADVKLLSGGVKGAPSGPEPVEEIVALTKAVRRQMRREKWKPS
jgi:Arc/MetJ-type ribon-helix-helix transcriptional regulator